MKSAMPYYGVTTPKLRALTKKIFDTHRLSNAVEWRDAVMTIWREAEYREERYAAIELTGHRFYRDFQTLDALPMYEEMIVTGAWWDFVDAIATQRLGTLLRHYSRPMRKTMLAWSRCRMKAPGGMWKRRAAILCQLSLKRDTHLDLLYACVEPSLNSKEFFLQKAIGWALRQYAWTDPREVKRYIRANADRLSALSKREALKNIGP